MGAGALGNEVLKNLALLGVGHILVIDFDTSGNIVPASIVAVESGVFATDAAGVAAGNPAPFGPGSKSERVQQLTAAVTGIVTAKDGNIMGRASKDDSPV